MASERFFDVPQPIPLTGVFDQPLQTECSQTVEMWKGTALLLCHVNIIKCHLNSLQ